MKTTMLMAASAVIALSVSGGAATAASRPAAFHAGTKAHRVMSPNRSWQVLYDQSGDDSGSAQTSQNFESSFDNYDAQGADDFTVPNGPVWRVTEVDVAGQYWNGYGPARSVTVIFYSDDPVDGAPGKVDKEFDDLPIIDSNGSFAIKLPKAVWMKPGTHWISVVANEDFAVGGQWGWEAQNGVHGSPAQWQNPGGGFAVCPKWGVASSCFGTSTGDFTFTLRGFLYKPKR